MAARYRTLGSRVLTRMASRVGIVIILVTLLGYWHVYRSVERSTLDNLEKYVHERGERESQPFLLAQHNLATLRAAFAETLKRPLTGEAEREFDRLFVRWPDGAWRRRPGDFNITQEASAFMSPQLAATPETKRRLLATYQLSTAYGRAWQGQVATTYLASLDGLYSTYWPGIDWAKATPPDIDIPKLHWVQNADPEHNPGRGPAWTGIWYDWVAHGWFATCILPLDIDGAFRHYGGTALSLESILQRTSETRLAGTYNLIFRADGRLISHPDYVDRIKAKNGDIDIERDGDPQLQALFRRVSAAGGPGVVELPESGEYLGIARIEGPGWYFVTVFPKALIASTARDAASAFLWLGLASLLLELLILYFIIRRHVAEPLRQLGDSAGEIERGNLQSRVAGGSDDELGRLAASFNRMAATLEEREAQLSAYADGLERTVTERTRELAQSKEEAEYLSLHDPLTGLPNRRLLQHLLVQALRHAERDESLLAVIFVDLDNFKAVNDRYGHRSGDRLLVAVAQRLEESLRKEDTAARFAGDEFIVLLPEIADPEDAHLVAAKLREAIAQPLAIGEDSLRIDASIGLALYPSDAQDADGLLQRADDAMYRHKEAHHGQPLPTA